MMLHKVVCSTKRVAQYKLLRIERTLYERTSDALQEWVRSDITTETEKLYYVTLGKLATANQRCLIRLNEIRKRLKLSPHIDETTYPVKLPSGDY